MIKKYIYFLPSIIIMSVVFYLSSLSSTGIGGSLTKQFLIHKALHVFVYGLLSASFNFALSKSANQTRQQIIPKSIIFAYIYGITDEVHQSFVSGRGGKFTDTLFDLSGALLGVWIYRQIQKLRC